MDMPLFGFKEEVEESEAEAVAPSTAAANPANSTFSPLSRVRGMTRMKRAAPQLIAALQPKVNERPAVSYLSSLTMNTETKDFGY